MCATWWRGYQRSARETSVTVLGKCAIERSTFTRFYTEENVSFLSRSSFRRDRKILVFASLVSSPPFLVYLLRSSLLCSLSLWIFASTRLSQTIDTTRDTSLSLWHFEVQVVLSTRFTFLRQILTCLPCSVDWINHGSKNRSYVFPKVEFP